MARNPVVEAMRASVSMGMMLAEAQTVITMRTLGMMGFWNLGPGESERMWSEKAEAMRQSGLALTGALMRGASPARATSAALAPVRRKTRSNVKRLAQRGPN
jgi:hypothetical protein